MSFGKVYRTRCTRCQKVQVHHNKLLVAVRMNVCPDCHVRTVVIGHEAEDRTPQTFERTLLSTKEQADAKRLLASVELAKE